jgi:hypothetical protein
MTTLGGLVGAVWTLLLLAASAWFLGLDWHRGVQENCASQCTTQAEVTASGIIAASLWMATIVILVALAVQSRHRRDD